MDKFKIFIMENITNMHVGNGDINFNIIDNEVQRDVITGFPIINPSSLKGSLRSFFNDNIKDIDKIKDIFGDEKKGIGKYKFFGASLLSIPVRSNVTPFFRATCPLIIKEFLEGIDNSNVKIPFKSSDIENILNKVTEKHGILLNNINKNEITAEGHSIKVIEEYSNLSEIITLLKRIFGKNLVIFHNDIFKDIIKELPVIARNRLNNGESENLWYEEIVPRKSRFYFGIIQDENSDNFNKLLTHNLVQFGGNSTIGYGYCNIKDLEEILKK